MESAGGQLMENQGQEIPDMASGSPAGLGGGGRGGLAGPESHHHSTRGRKTRPPVWFQRWNQDQKVEIIGG